jgi:hypothetical protein
MMRRTIFMTLVVGLLVSGFLSNVLAEGRIRPFDPGSDPWQFGDPDWPAFSKIDRCRQFLAEEQVGLLSIEPIGPASRSFRPQQAGSMLDERRSLSRRYEMRILGRTIRIWR